MTRPRIACILVLLTCMIDNPYILVPLVMAGLVLTSWR